MFKLNLKIAFRNLYKNKRYTLVNIFGLALGLAGIIFVLMYINYERSYDTWDDELRNVYQVQELDLFSLKEGRAEWSEQSDAGFMNPIKLSLPNVVALTAITKIPQDRSFMIEGREPFLVSDICNTDSAFFSVFPYQFLHGNRETALKAPNCMVISQDFARKHFGETNPVGKTVRLGHQYMLRQDLAYTITGVVHKPVTPSVIDFSILIQGREYKVSDYFQDFRPVYIRVNSGERSENLSLTLQQIYKPFRAAAIKRQGHSFEEYTKNGNKPSVRLRSFYSLHQEPLNGDNWLDTLKPIILLSSLLLIISVINFVNLSTAQAVYRAKEVGIRKVSGASRLVLVRQFLLETLIQCLLALIIAVIMLELLLPYLNETFALSLSMSGISDSAIIALQLFGLVIIVSALSGCYPALVLSSYEPHRVLKGNFSQGRQGLTLRNILVGLQFVIAVGFLVGIMIIWRQLDYMQSRDPGFDPQAVLHFKDPFYPQYTSKLKEIEGVQYVGDNNGNVYRHINLTAKYRYKAQEKELNTVFVNTEGLQAVGAKLLRGRLFDSMHQQDTTSTVILNESLEKLYGESMLGKFISYRNDSVRVQVIGIIKDIQISGFDQPAPPTIYTASRKNATDYPNFNSPSLIRYDQAKERQVLSALKDLWKELTPNYPANYVFLEDDFKALFVVHERFGKMVMVFSTLSIFLSLIGLFSLTAYVTRLRAKEIAVRKVLGAADTELLLLLNRNYAGLMFIANVIAWPLIYVAIRHWLNGFAYRIEIPLMPFVAGFFISMLVTAITVSLQVRKTIKGNPVDALKYE